MSDTVQIPLSAKRLSASDEVLITLTGWIETGKLKSGALFPPERQIAAQLGVSRVVVREATKKLEHRGLVSIRQGIGVEVINNRSLPIQESLNFLVPEERLRLRQCAQARLLIEPELAALAAQNITPEFLQKMRDAQERLRTEQDIKKVALHDIAFHDAVAEMAGNAVLGLMLTSFAELGRISREHTLREYGFRRAYDFHETIFAAIAIGDPEGARLAMKNHLTAALGDLS